MNRRDEAMASCYRRLPLQGLCNARDLGGYPTKDGGITNYGVFIRSEAPRSLTTADMSFLKDYGISKSIDFRGDKEINRQPSFLKDVRWIHYINSPTFNEQVAFGTRASGGGPPVTAFVEWGKKYIEMAEDCTGWVKQTFEIIAESTGAVHFNCTTGKDRTGVIAALLLGLSGVADEDIIADYCISQVYLTPVYEELMAAFLKHWPNEKVSLSDPFFKTDPDNMMALLQYFKSQYGGIEGYLAACGVNSDTLCLIRRRLSFIS